VKVTLVYDNTGAKEGLLPDYGFSCYIEIENMPRILFDTGAKGKTLLYNMHKLGIDPAAIDIIVISHAHWDHTGGLTKLLEVNQRASLYVPTSFQPSLAHRSIVAVSGPMEIIDNVFSTGELMGVEQSLAIRTDRGLIVVSGCAHPGVGPILDAASSYGTVSALIGGLHGFREFELLKDFDLICACHCTANKSQIKTLYPDKWVEGGVGTVIEY
jgi:7,8-dihydropterin-6-yl-methyl-4-(beta-D-ribofuranosyl)aminobenzene 5'-phosphate synthase